MNDDFTIVGMGPAGIAAALKLSQAGFRVRIVEALPKPAVKPCGWGIPQPDKLPFKIPEEAILSHVDGATLYVNGEHVLDYTGNNLGLIVDKPRMLLMLAEEYDIDVSFKDYFNPRCSGGECGSVILAPGISFYKGEKINAVQLHLETDNAWSNFFEFHFDPYVIGYYWVFPTGRHKVKVGVGGFKPVKELTKHLELFIRRDERLRSGKRVSRLEGAQLAVDGVKLPHMPPYVIGEAAGFVYPLTGEGIRPSIISGWSLGEALSEGRDPVKALGNSDVSWKIKLQRKILEAVKSLTPERRAGFLSNLNPEVIIRIGLGDFTKYSLLRLALKSPRGLASILRSFI